MRIKSKQMLAALALSTMIAGMGALGVHAEGNTYIDISNSNPKPGDTITVQVRATESDLLTLSYDNTKLDLQSVNANDYSTDSNRISFRGMSGSMTFRVTEAGAAGLRLSAEDPSIAASSVRLQVSPQRSEQTQNHQEAPDAQESASANTQGSQDFTINGMSYTISERFSGQSLPTGFSVTRKEVHNYNYRVLENTTMNMTLLYLKQSDRINEAGSFYIYYPDGDRVEPFRQIISGSQFLVLESAPQVSGLLAENLEISGTSYPAYQDTQGRHYIYGIDNQGQRSWFEIDSKGNFHLVSNIESQLAADSQQKQESPSVASSDTSQPKSNPLSNLLTWIRSLPITLLSAIAGGLALIIVILLILLLRRRRRSKETLELEDLNDFAEDDGGEQNQKLLLSQDTIIMPEGGLRAEDLYSSESSEESVARHEPMSVQELEPLQEKERKQESTPAQKPESKSVSTTSAKVTPKIRPEKAVQDTVEQKRRERLSLLASHFGDDVMIEEEEEEEDPQSMPRDKELFTDAVQRDRMEEQIKSASYSEDRMDTRSLDPGDISVKAENQGSNDGVLEAVEAAVAYARRKAEEEARKGQAPSSSKHESREDLKVIDFNDL